MGMPLYGMQPPTGYSTKSDVWVNSAALLDRMNFAPGAGRQQLAGDQFDLAQLTSGATTSDADPYKVQLELEQTLLDGNVSQQTHQTIEDEHRHAAGYRAFLTPTGPRT